MKSKWNFDYVKLQKQLIHTINANMLYNEYAILLWFFSIKIAFSLRINGFLYMTFMCLSY